MSAPRNGRLMNRVAAKATLSGAGLAGDNIHDLATAAMLEIARLSAMVDVTQQVLREHGFSPNGKRLPAAVDEALRISKRGQS